jgi:membrane protein
MLLKKSLRQFLDHDMATYAAAVTYHVLFSLVPFSIVFLALIALLDLSVFFDWLRHQAEAFFLPETVEQVNAAVDQLQQRRIGMLSLGAAVALWTSSSAMRAAMNALNVVYGVKEERPAWRRILLSIFWTLAVGSLLVVATVLVLITPAAMEQAARMVGLERGVAMLWAWWFRWPAVVLLLTLTVATVYRIAPDVEQRFRFVTPGAFLAVLAWFGASLGFNFYVRTVSNYSAVYGSVGTLVVLLLYFYLSAVVLLLGAEINAAAEDSAPRGKNAGEKRLRQAAG